MKACSLLLLVLSLLFPAQSGAREFLGAPVIPQGQTIEKTATRLKLSTGLSHDDVLAFYRNALKGYENIRFREWEDTTYIEDDGSRDWHSITISKGNPKETTVIIAKDSWTWIMGTLLLRFVGVFVVLLVVFLGMSLSGSIISRSVKRIEARNTARDKQ